MKKMYLLILNIFTIFFLTACADSSVISPDETIPEETMPEETMLEKLTEYQ